MALDFIDVIGALEPLSSVDTSQSAAVVLSASMHAVRDVVFTLAGCLRHFDQRDAAPHGALPEVHPGERARNKRVGFDR